MELSIFLSAWMLAFLTFFLKSRRLHVLALMLFISYLIYIRLFSVQDDMETYYERVNSHLNSFYYLREFVFWYFLRIFGYLNLPGHIPILLLDILWVSLVMKSAKMLTLIGKFNNSSSSIKYYHIFFIFA